MCIKIIISYFPLQTTTVSLMEDYESVDADSTNYGLPKQLTGKNSSPSLLNNFNITAEERFLIEEEALNRIKDKVIKKIVKGIYDPMLIYAQSAKHERRSQSC